MFSLRRTDPRYSSMNGLVCFDVMPATDVVRWYEAPAAGTAASVGWLLFAQPLARITRMRADQITAHDDGHVTVTFDTVPIELPKRLTARHLYPYQPTTSSGGPNLVAANIA